MKIHEVTEKYIRDKYDLEEERLIIKRSEFLLDFDDVADSAFDAWLNLVKSTFEVWKRSRRISDAILRVQNKDARGHVNCSHCENDMHVVAVWEENESDSDVIERLMTHEKQEIRLQEKELKELERLTTKYAGL